VEDDIRHALDYFFEQVPTMKEIAIWGLCDAASAALFYAHKDPRVRGLVLLNPWVRTEEGMAKAYLKHYYLSRLSDRELWSKILRGRFDYRSAMGSMFRMIGKALPGRAANTIEAAPTGVAAAPLPERMRDGFEHFDGRVLLIISGNDLTAKEFLDVVAASHKWQKLLQSPRVQRRDLPEANHTFSQRDWRDQVASWTSDWIKSW